MVILSVSVCNKKGKILLARQYVPMSRLRIEGLLSAFPKLIDSDERSTSKQHTFIETDEVRYIYQPMDALYLLLVTNMQSNILEDLATLRMIAKLIPEYCGGHDEETVSDNAFSLVYALDEVVTPMGYREQVNYKQIEDFVKMDSAEEKLNQIIEDSKIQNQKEIMRKRAAEFDKKRSEDRKKNASPGSFGYKGLSALDALSSRFSGGSRGSSDTGPNAISSDSLKFQNDSAGQVHIEYNSNDRGNKYGNNNSDDDNSYKSKTKKKKKRGARLTGMTFGSSKKKDKLFSEAKKVDEATLNEKSLNLLHSKGGMMAMGVDDDVIDASDLPPVEIVISEKLFIIFDRDGAIKKFEIKGDMEVAVNNPDATQCVIETNIIPNKKIKSLPSLSKPNWRLHPKMDSGEWKKGILCLKDKQKKFRVGRSNKTSILKWKMTTDDESMVPLSFTFWPESESNGSINISAQYEVTLNGDDERTLKNVIITFPTPCNEEPEIESIDGDYAFYRNDKELQWILNDLNDGDSGSLEYSVEDVELSDLWPVSIHFEMEETYSQIAIKTVHDVDDEEQYEFTSGGSCVAEKYVVE